MRVNRHQYNVIVVILLLQDLLISYMQMLGELISFILYRAKAVFTMFVFCVASGVNFNVMDYSSDT